MEESNDVDPQFQWGIKRGVGGAKKDVQFYGSFTLDGVKYMLNDCVYLFTKGETEPYVGKILKIWEQGDHKKVKILWFFRPNEILNYLGDHKPMEKELFMASGEGVGLANINPLEAIAGKCSVICTSKDERNLQAPKNALEKADFIFYCTFDVGTFIISNKFPDKIATVEVKFLLNREEDLVNGAFSNHQANGCGANEKAEAAIGAGALPSSDSNKEKTVDPARAPRSIPSKDNVIEKKHQNEAKHHLSEESHPKSKSERYRDVGEANNSDGHRGDEKVTSVKNKGRSDLSNEKPSKRLRLSDDSLKSDDLPKDKHTASGKSVVTKPDKDDCGQGAIQVNKEKSAKMKLSDNKGRSLDEPQQKVPSDVSMKDNTKAEHQMLEVTRRPDADRSKWFKALPWEDRMQKAHEQGTLILLQNFDPSFTSAAIEDIIYHTFKQSCTAKIIPVIQPYHNPHYGQAYVIFKTQDAANEAIQRINMGCLMLPNGSPLVASKGMLKMPLKATALPGHLLISKIKMTQREDMRKAVSTSHCSQPNTIEYEMALDWILLQERTVHNFNLLYKSHADDVKKVRKNMNTKK